MRRECDLRALVDLRLLLEAHNHNRALAQALGRQNREGNWSGGQPLVYRLLRRCCTSLLNSDIEFG